MPRIVWFVAAIAILLAAAFLLPVQEYLQAMFAWIEQYPSVSWLIYIGVYVVSTVLLLPGSILTIGAGFLFGLGFGYVVVAIASVTGASFAFLIGRFLARDWVESKLSAMPKFAALDRAVEQRGALIVLLTRLSPVFPFNLLNYGLGLTGVKFWTYVLVSWLGMIPGTLLFVYLGSVASSLSSVFTSGVDSGEAGGWLLYVGLAATLVLTIILTRIATKVLNEHLDTPTDSDKQEGAST